MKATSRSELSTAENSTRLGLERVGGKRPWPVCATRFIRVPSGHLAWTPRQALLGAILASAAALFWSSSLLSAETKPSMEETVNYMNSKLALCPAGFAQAVTLHGQTLIEVTGHSVAQPGRYQTRLTNAFTGEFTSYNSHRVQFSLADLRLNVKVADLEEHPHRHQIEDEPYDITVVSVRCAEVGCVRVLKPTKQSEGGHWAERFLYHVEGATEYHFFICEDDAAVRFEKALMHALELGGAREELF